MTSAAAHTNMIQGQLKPNKIVNPAVLQAFQDVPRERFVPAPLQALAYIDEDICLNPDAASTPRFLMEPVTLARLIQAANITPQDHVLDIGCATGYSSALLSLLAKSVVGVEENDGLARHARATLSDLGCKNVDILKAPLSKGAPARAPFDVILLGGAVAHIPEALFKQLTPQGRLLAVVDSTPERGVERSVGKATLFQKFSTSVSATPLFDAHIPALPDFQTPRGFVF